VRDLLTHVIDSHGKLVRPVSIAIAEEQIPALFRRCLLDAAERQIIELLGSRGEPDAKSPPWPLTQSTLAAISVIPFACDPFPAAVTRIHLFGTAQPIECRPVNVLAITLPDDRMKTLIRFETKPREVFEQRLLEHRTAPDAIVIFESQRDAPFRRASQAPDEDCIDDVTQVKEPGRRRGKTCQHVSFGEVSYVAD